MDDQLGLSISAEPELPLFPVIMIDWVIEDRSMSIRGSLGQLSWFLKSYPHPRAWRQQAQAIRDLTLPPLPRAPKGERRQVWAVSVVRDEADIIEHTVRHLLSQGIDHVLVADNRSTDETPEILRELGRETGRVHLARDHHVAHIQSQKVTYLAHAAWRHGARWIIPFDADEFWFARGQSVASYLQILGNIGIVHADFFHMVPVDGPVTDPSDATFVLDSHPSFPGKVAAQAHPLLYVGPGNHYAARVGGETGGLAIAHAQYRGPEQVARKLRQGAVTARMTGEDTSWFSPHWEAGSLLDDHEIQSVWERISAGLPDERIQFAALGPMVRVKPLQWETWDPDNELTIEA